jgi:hypothetical protein
MIDHLERQKIWKYFTESVVYHGFILMEPNLASKARFDLWPRPEHCDCSLNEMTFSDVRFEPLRQIFVESGLKTV